MSNNTINGVIYYKQGKKYDGDVTKYCGLTGGEIDSNVFFLRGYDIKDITTDDVNNCLIINRVNGEKIIVENIKTTIDKDKTYYDSQNGILHLCIGDTEHLIEGFYYDEKDIQIYTNSPLCGNGKSNSPLNIDKTVTLNQFVSANRLVDTTRGEHLPLTEIPGTYLITKEYMSPYGLLYNIDGVKEIEDILMSENSGWRIPTDEEWGEMLNAIEINSIDKTHISSSMGELGKYAGSILKENVQTWRKTNNVSSVSDFMNYFTGFKVYPSGNKTTSGNNSFGINTFFWTSSKINNSSFLTRSISYDKEGVERVTVNDEVFISLRLIRNYNDSINTVEYINNVPVETILMPYVKMDDNGHIIEEGNKVWTSHNVSIPLNMIGNCMDSDGDIETHFYINHWNGKSWDKYRLSESTRIVLGMGIDNSLNKEWIIKGDNIVRCDNEIFEKITSTEETINIRFEGEIQSISNSLTSLNEKFTTNINDVKRDIQSINETLSNVEGDTILGINNSISTINERITTLSNETQNSLNGIIERIVNMENTIIDITNSLNSLNEKMKSAITINNVDKYAVTSISSGSGDIIISNKTPEHTPLNTGDVILTLDWLYNISEGDAQNINNN